MPEHHASTVPPPTPARGALAGMLPWLAVAAVIAGLDQLTKQIMLGALQRGEVVTITSFFDLVLVYNPGAAFSFLAEHSGWQRWLFTGLAVAVCGWLLTLIHQHRAERLLPLSFALIIGGAIGNVIDRLVHGAVVDFLFFHAGRYGWPAFNLADSAITVGVVLMLWGQFRHDRRARPTEPHPENPS